MKRYTIDAEHYIDDPEFDLFFVYDTETRETLGVWESRAQARRHKKELEKKEEQQ